MITITSIQECSHLEGKLDGFIFGKSGSNRCRNKAERGFCLQA